MTGDNANSSLQSQLVPGIYLNLVSLTILYYDYALTLQLEIDRFWTTRSISWASVLFYLNRYLTLLGHIPLVVWQDYIDSQALNKAQMRVEIFFTWQVTQLTTDLKSSCTSLALYHQYLAIVIQVIVGIVLIMRTYALYDRKLYVLVFTSAYALAVIIFGAWSVTTGRGSGSAIIHPEIVCVSPLSKADAIRLGNAWIGMLMFDLIIFVMTLYGSWRRNRGGNTPLLFILLRDGVIYFGIMAIVGLLNIITFYISPDYQRGFITTFANIISSTMISRLMLNLRDPKLAAQYRTRIHHEYSSTALSTIVDLSGGTTTATNGLT